MFDYLNAVHGNAEWQAPLPPTEPLPVGVIADEI